MADVGLVDDVDRTYPYRSEIDFLNNQVDTKTATITMRGRLANPYSADPAAPRPPLFRPGMFARVRGKVEVLEGALLVPRRAVMQRQTSRYVYIVGDGDRVQQRADRRRCHHRRR